MGTVIVTLLAFAAAVWLIKLAYTSYNSMNALWHPVGEAQSNIATAVQRRTRLTDQLFDIAERYAGHEKVVHFRLSSDRSRGFFVGLGDLFPALKSDGTYITLMNRLPEIESDVQFKYEEHNRHARAYNQGITQMPSMLFAGLFGFTPYLSPPTTPRTTSPAPPLPPSPSVEEPAPSPDPPPTRRGIVSRVR